MEGRLKAFCMKAIVVEVWPTYAKQSSKSYFLYSFANRNLVLRFAAALLLCKANLQELHLYLIKRYTVHVCANYSLLQQSLHVLWLSYLDGAKTLLHCKFVGLTCARYHMH